MRTVLVVDDSPEMRQKVCELFTREADFTVCGQAENGKEAVTMALTLRPSLIVIDLSMPELDGLSAIRTLKPLMPDVPFILYTAHDAAVVRDEASKAGAAGVIPKSSSPQLLIATARALTAKIPAA
jgi:two-component system, NarL family, response regulator NreC